MNVKVVCCPFFETNVESALCTSVAGLSHKHVCSAYVQQLFERVLWHSPVIIHVASDILQGLTLFLKSRE